MMTKIIFVVFTAIGVMHSMAPPLLSIRDTIHSDFKSNRDKAAEEKQMVARRRWEREWPAKNTKLLTDALTRWNALMQLKGELSILPIPEDNHIPLGTGKPESALGTKFVIGARLADTGTSIVHEVTKVDAPREKLVIKYRNNCGPGGDPLLNEFEMLEILDGSIAPRVLYISDAAPLGSAWLAESNYSREHPEECREVDSTFRFMIMERATESIDGYFRKLVGRSPSAESLLEAVFQFGIEGAELLQELHLKGILHLNVQPGSFLRMSSGRMVLTEFGESEFYDESQTFHERNIFLNTDLLSPWQLRNVAPSPKDDMFRLVETMVEFATGFSYYHSIRKQKIHAQQIALTRLERTVPWATVSDKAREMDDLAVTVAITLKRKLKFFTSFTQSKISKITEFLTSKLIPLVSQETQNYAAFIDVLREAASMLIQRTI